MTSAYMILATLALALGVTTTTSASSGELSAAGQVQALLRESSSTSSAARSIAKIGPEVVPELFGAVRDGRWSGGESVDREKRVVLIEALGRLLDPHVRDHFARFVATPESAKDRNTALQILSEIGEADDLLLVQRLATGDGTDDLTLTWFEIAVRGILVRDASAAHRKLDRLWSKATAEQRLPVVRAVGVAGRRAGLDFLQEVLGKTESPDGEILRQIERIAGDLVPPSTHARVDRIRPFLDRDEPDLRASALLCLGVFEDAGSTSSMIARLGDPDAAVRKAAHRALQEMTGHTFGPDSRRWLTWHDDELQWADAARDDALDRLSDDNRSRVALAVREISHHRLARDELALELVGILSRSEVELRALTCASLGQLGSRAAISALVECLERDEADAVREAAGRALVEITKKDLPPDFETWRAEFPDIDF